MYVIVIRDQGCMGRFWIFCQQDPCWILIF
jgi:hypothetical protein